jgi:putative peptidoglycan lipid II flippase
VNFNGQGDWIHRTDTMGGYMKRQINPAKSAAMIMLVTLGSKMLGFLREAVIAANYGTGIESDAYFIAQTIHYTLFYSMFASIAIVFIPIYTERLLTEGEHGANRFTNNVIHTLLLFSILISGLVTLFARQIVLFFAPGFQADSLSLTIKIIKVMFPMLAVTCLFNLFKGILRARQSFLVPASTGYPFSIIIILGCTYFSSQYGIYALVVSTVLGEISQLLIQLPALKGKYKYSFSLHICDKGLQRLSVVVLPVLIGTAVRQLNTLVDRALASNLGMGSISAINYSNILIEFVFGIFIVAISNVVYPMFSQLIVKKY